MDNYHPDMTSGGNIARQRVTVTFQQWGYAAERSTILIGDCSSSLVMETAVSRISRDLIEEKGVAAITMKDTEGKTLLIGDDENQGECFLKDIAVKAEIILLDQGAA